MQIQNNIASKNAARNQKAVRGNLDKSLEKLSTGYKINRAGDNAAGLAISEIMRNQINGLDQAMKNVNDGIGMSQTGEGTLTEIHSMLQRLKTLAVQSANGTYTTVARAGIEVERTQMLDEIDRISHTSNFDDIPLFGKLPKPTNFVIAPPQKKDDITLQIGYSSDETLDVGRYFLESEALLLDQTDFTSVDNANISVDIIDNAIHAVSQIRASFGAAQNHLEHTHTNLSITRENVTASESNIRDTNIAVEFTNFTKENIIYQSAGSMMAQANTLPDLVVKLLQGA